MGKITDALKKAAEERVGHIEKLNRVRATRLFVARRTMESQIDPRVVAFFDPKAAISEQYKILRTNILSLNKGNPPRTLVVTSSTQGEGKTITCLNLAVAMVHSNRKTRVLLIDADMRRGRTAEYLGVKAEVGLSEVLKGEAELEQALYHVEAIENLTVLSSGKVPDHPVELVGSTAMQDLLKTAATQFDIVIIDTPPIISVTDAGIIGSMADGVLMVVRAGKTQRGLVARAEELLYQSHAKVLGRVLTNIEYHVPEYIYRYL